jgi:hypothetical protein
MGATGAPSGLSGHAARMLVVAFADVRLRDRYMELVRSHSGSAGALAAGVHALPGAASSLAATQAAYRFFNNPNVTLADVAEPMIELARGAASTDCDEYLLVAQDWSQVMYPEQDSKQDRISLSSRNVPEGYELHTALLVSDRTGDPLAPLEMSLRAADGVHESRSSQPRPALSPLDELAPMMRHVEGLNLGKPAVHIIDAEADSVFHYRDWDPAGHLFLVRADNRLAAHGGVEKRFSTIRAELREQGAFRDTRDVLYRGKSARQFVAETAIVLTRAAQRNRPKAGDRQRIPGEPLPLRLVIAEVRAKNGTLLATWFLLTNVPAAVAPETIALWYYWRWSIEELFKLLKSGGQQIETWQQETAAAIARRLWVAAMACATVWRIGRSRHPDADAVRTTLIRLSGRQMKRRVPHTMPALLAGLWTLLAMLDILEHHTLDELKHFARLAQPLSISSGFV